MKSGSILVKRGNLRHRCILREMPCGDEGRDWGDASTNQGTPRIAGDHEQLGEHGADAPSGPQSLPLEPAPSPSIDHLVALLQPADAGHPPPGRGAIQVHDHVILCHQEFQTADDVPGHRGQGTQ